ncbi:MAG: hypothetical protein UZ12_BCD005000256 [Bacteroidetes bacterium OLB12]|nr:MAG: hypothetical protein UZ12_BCD005000256 [Bacteroidetes bacterium OLB12]HNR73651.1 hypothetical protein [Cyclobacteriaceae bacterium]HNU42803.1 hypothetical protein [Cyclobacteriaceae bacterium]
MISKSWFVIKDENTRTFEVVTQSLSENAFSNKVVAMQREGLNITPVLLPVSNRHASKEHISFTGYTREEGLFNRLLQQHAKLMQQKFGEWEE